MAELTFVRINDLAAPPEPIHPLVIIEPFVAILIVANGIMPLLRRASKSL